MHTALVDHSHRIRSWYNCFTVFNCVSVRLHVRIMLYVELYGKSFLYMYDYKCKIKGNYLQDELKSQIEILKTVLQKLINTFQKHYT